MPFVYLQSSPTPLRLDGQPTASCPLMAKAGSQWLSFQTQTGMTLQVMDDVLYESHSLLCTCTCRTQCGSIR